MDKLKAMQLLVQVSELGSFSKVAEQCGTTKSMVSKQIAKLEEALGARLLQRSTRQLQLTPLGDAYLQRCRNILQQVDEAELHIQDELQLPKGKLRVNAPMALGLTALRPAISAFMQQYPDIELDIQLSDESLDLIQHNFDVGLRVASRSFDSPYVGRRLAHFDYRICASAAYLASHDPIRRASDLKKHNCFEYTYFRDKNLWPVGGQGIAISGQLKANSSVFLLEIIKLGEGIGFIPSFICQNALDTGELVEILAKTRKPKMTLYALYPERRFMPPRLARFLEFMAEHFKESGQA